jgi:hypothetical protein
MQFTDSKERMKSSAAQLEHRGFCTTDALQEHRSKDTEALCGLLTDGRASLRTAAAVLLGERRAAAALPALCTALAAEKKLYTKIALCEAMAAFGEDALPHLLPLIGRIPGTQHRTIGLVDLGKRSFPLPRDIISRTVIRIGPAALPRLEAIVEHGAYEQQLEAIDAIGHIAYTSCDVRSEAVLVKKYADAADELTRWKLVRAFQSFGGEDVEDILKTIIESDTHNVMLREAERSLERITTRNGRLQER